MPAILLSEKTPRKETLMARRHRDNPLAPELPGRLSDETMAQVAERRTSIQLSR